MRAICNISCFVSSNSFFPVLTLTFSWCSWPLDPSHKASNPSCMLLYQAHYLVRLWTVICDSQIFPYNVQAAYKSNCSYLSTATRLLPQVFSFKSSPCHYALVQVNKLCSCTCSRHGAVQSAVLSSPFRVFIIGNSAVIFRLYICIPADTWTCCSRVSSSQFITALSHASWKTKQHVLSLLLLRWNSRGHRVHKVKTRIYWEDYCRRL